MKKVMEIIILKSNEDYNENNDKNKNEHNNEYNNDKSYENNNEKIIKIIIKIITQTKMKIINANNYENILDDKTKKFIMF